MCLDTTSSDTIILLDRREFIIIAAMNLAALFLDVKTVRACQTDPPVKSDYNKKLLPKGIHAVTNTANWIIKDEKRINLFEIDFVDGLVNYARWADIEKEEGEYDWTSFDRMIKEASSNRKTLSYNIISGNHAPDWLYQKHGIYPYEYYIPPKNKSLKTFLPWVNIEGKRVLNTSVLEIWENTISSFGQYIHNHPLRDAVSYVAITGGPTGNGLEVAWPKGTFDEFQKLNWDEEAEELLVQFWMKLTDIFIRHIPAEIPLGLAFTDSFGINLSGTVRRNIVIPKRIVDYALETSRSQNRIIVPMGLWLGNIETDDLKSHPLIKLIMGFKTPFALQGDVRTLKKRHLKKMLSRAVDINASWIELWHSDIINKRYKRIIRKTGNRIKSTDMAPSEKIEQDRGETL